MADPRAGGESGPSPGADGRLSAYLADLRRAWARLLSLPRGRYHLAATWQALPARARATWNRLAPDSSKIVRLTAAAVIAYLIVGVVYPGVRDLTGPLTALLVVQASLVQTFSSGLGRIAAVLTGVLVATILASVTGLTWWSLGLAIGVALTLATLMNLGDHVLETPISAMLILGVSAPETAAETRVAMTLIGALVGVGFTLLLPPPVMTAGIPEAVRDVADRTAGAVRNVADELPSGASPGRFDVWIRGVHRVLPLVASADALISDAESRRRFNPRAIGRDEPLPVLRAGLASFDRIVLALRHTLMSLQSRHPGEAGRETNEEALLGVLAVIFRGVGDAVEQHGRFVWAEATGHAEQAAEAHKACDEHVDETRAMLAELALAAPGAGSDWLVDPTVLAGIESIFTEMGAERRRRRLADWQARQAASGVFRPPQVLDRPWLARTRGKRPPGDRPPAARPEADPEAPSSSGATDTPGPRRDPASEAAAGPPTLSISYGEGLASSAPEPPARRRRPTSGSDGAGRKRRPDGGIEHR